MKQTWLITCLSVTYNEIKDFRSFGVHNEDKNRAKTTDMFFSHNYNNSNRKSYIIVLTTYFQH